MKKIFLTTLAFVFLTFCFVGIHAQTVQTKLNQVELMKQFIGNWKCDYSKDTIFTFEITSFGNLGMEWSAKILVKGKTIDEEKSLWGYDKERDKYIGIRLLKSSTVRHRALLFTSEKTCEYLRFVLSNPEEFTSKDIIEFKSSDIMIQTPIRNNKPGKSFTISRVK